MGSGMEDAAERAGPCTWSANHFQPGSVAGSPPQTTVTTFNDIHHSPCYMTTDQGWSMALPYLPSASGIQTPRRAKLWAITTHSGMEDRAQSIYAFDTGDKEVAQVASSCS